jgi:hypothetical protein
VLALGDDVDGDVDADTEVDVEGIPPQPAYMAVTNMTK